MTPSDDVPPPRLEGARSEGRARPDQAERQPVRRRARYRASSRLGPSRRRRSQAHLRPAIVVRPPDLLEVLAHELRTPLTTLYGVARLLERRRTPPAVREELIDAVSADAIRLVRILDDVLSVIDATAGSIRTEPVLLQRLLQRTILELLVEVPDGRVKLAVTPDLPPVEADPDALSHAVGNLVRHALQASRRRSAVHVTAEGEPDGVLVAVHVQPAEGLVGSSGLSLAHEPDQAAGPGGRLWLTAASALVHAMGGRLAVIPTTGGQEVQVRLPLARDEPVDTGEPVGT
jgi:two-component system sensor histidine kinase KdpD